MSVSKAADLHYERLSEDLIPTLLPIEHEAYPDPWTVAMFRQELDNPASYFCVAYLDDRLVGYGGFWFVVDEIHVTKVTVALPHRGYGYGRALMAHLEQHGRTLGAVTSRLEVRERNTPARTLYARIGYRPVGLRRGYYAKTNETAVVMSKVLSAEFSA